MVSDFKSEDSGYLRQIWMDSSIKYGIRIALIKVTFNNQIA